MNLAVEELDAMTTDYAQVKSAKHSSALPKPPPNTSITHKYLDDNQSRCDQLNIRPTRSNF